MSRFSKGYEEFFQYCCQNALSFDLSYGESSDEMEIRVSSPAPAECYYEKRAIGFLEFIEHHKQHMKRNVE